MHIYTYIALLVYRYARGVSRACRIPRVFRRLDFSCGNGAAAAAGAGDRLAALLLFDLTSRGVEAQGVERHGGR